jgi:hypothetical protein
LIPALRGKDGRSGISFHTSFAFGKSDLPDTDPDTDPDWEQIKRDSPPAPDNH